MARRIEGGELSPNANTVYSKTFRINSTRVALVAQVGNNTAVTITVQGAITDGTWVDTAMTAATLNNVTQQIGAETFNVWPLLRVAVTSAGTNTVAFRLIGLSGDDD